MRRILIITAVMLLAIPVMAQEEGCEIDLSEVEALLSEAQAAADDGDTTTALDRIAEMQDVLDRIRSECVTLGQTFEAPDESFSFDYPNGWTLGDYESEGEGLSSVFVGSSATVIDEMGRNQPSLQSGEQLVGFLFGSLSEITGSAENPETLEVVITALTEFFKSQYPNISGAEFFSHNDHRAGSFEFSGDSFAAIVMVIEYREGERYMAVIGLSAPSESEALRSVVDAIALTIRVEGRL